MEVHNSEFKDWQSYSKSDHTDPLMKYKINSFILGDGKCDPCGHERSKSNEGTCVFIFMYISVPITTDHGKNFTVTTCYLYVLSGGQDAKTFQTSDPVKQKLTVTTLMRGKQSR